MDKFKNKNFIVAGIDVGSHSLKMKIAQVNSDGSIKTLENLRRTLSLGKDTFAIGKINFETVKRTCEILKGFKQIMKEYDIDMYKEVATSALREAQNKEYMIDQIKSKTGLDIEIISNSEEKYLTYKAIRENFNDYKKFRREGALVLDIGSGSIDISLYNNNSLVYTQSMKLGSLRIKEILSSLERRTLDFSSILEEYIESNTHGLKIFRNSKQIKHFIGIGGEISIISKICNKTNDFDKLKFIDKDIFMKYYKKLMYKPLYQLVKEYKIPAERADILIPSMIIYKQFLNLTTSTGINAPLVSLRDGLICDIVDKIFDTYRNREFNADIISSTRHIAQRYRCDMDHSSDVEKKALVIFDALKNLHGLDTRERLLLRIAAILHDIGKFINLVDHNFNSYNIIKSLDIIGISKKEIEMIANTTRYHDKSEPSINDYTYRILNSEERIVVSKLIAILKIANALDMNHKQKVKDLNVIYKDDEVVIEAISNNDALLEIWTLESTVDFFKEVFGVKLEIKMKRMV